MTCISSPQSVPFLAHWWGPRVQSLIAAPVVGPIFDPNFFGQGATGTFNGLWPHPQKIPEQKLPCLKFFLRGYQFVLGQRDFVDVTKGTLQMPNAPTFPFWVFITHGQQIEIYKKGDFITDGGLLVYAASPPGMRMMCPYYDSVIPGPRLPSAPPSPAPRTRPRDRSPVPPPCSPPLPGFCFPRLFPKCPTPWISRISLVWDVMNQRF